jgi:hypothetical protein
MKYTIVKQFSNQAIDNMYSFMFKIVDFGKILYEALWGFLEVWIAFYLIFYNFFMYFVYIFLYMLDRGADESRSTLTFWKRSSGRVSSAPSIKIAKPGYNPIPKMYGGSISKPVKSTVNSVTSVAKDTISSIKTTSPRKGFKTNWIKLIFESIINFFIIFGEIILKPFKVFINFFEDKMKPVKDGDSKKAPQRESLIDSYLKEYEKSKSKKK